MSLLEDVFLHDEAGEAQELERVIEGDEYDERPRASSPGDSDDNSAKEDEAEDDKRRVDPESKPKRIIKNPRFILNPARLTGPRGIQVIPEHFKDFKFKGKGREKEDLDMVLKKLEHWAYRLYPKFQFEDCLKKIETLGKKRPVMVHLHKIRSDQFTSEETVVQRDSSDDETPAPVPEEDEFDKLLQQQIEIARATPAQKAKRPDFTTPRHDVSPLAMPKATSSPSISDEQRERMLRNRQLAEERRLAKLKQTSAEPIEIVNEINTAQIRKSNIDGDSDSSNDECDLIVVNQSVVADVHDINKLAENDTNIPNDVQIATNTDSLDITKEIDIETIIENDKHSKESAEIGKSVPDKDSNEELDTHVEINKDCNMSKTPSMDIEKDHCVAINSISKSNPACESLGDDIQIFDKEDSKKKEKISVINDSVPNDATCAVDTITDEEIMDIDFSDNF